MSLIRYQNQWNPWKEMEELQSRLSSAFGGGPSRLPLRTGEDERIASAQWAPLVDILEDEKEYLIKAELPEVNKADLSVKVQDGVLTLSGERKFEREDKTRRYHRVERVYGSFYRSFTLPDDSDHSNVSAGFKDGVLLVHVAKCEKAMPKQVDVKVS